MLRSITGWILALLLLAAMATGFGALVNDEKLWPLALILFAIAVGSN